MRLFLLFGFLFVMSSFAGCPVNDDDDSSPGHTPTPEDSSPLPAEAFVVDIMGEFWGYYGGEAGYGIDVMSDTCLTAGLGSEVIVYYYGELFPPYTDCSTLGADVGFSLDFTGCEIDSRAQLLVEDCAADSGMVDALIIEASPTYEDGSSPTDVYGSVYVHMTLEDGSTLEVSGPFSHCPGGQPCRSEDIDGGASVAFPTGRRAAVYNAR